MLDSQISHYRVLKKIGQGGMGEVYLAEDTRLQRKVALKILPAGVAAEPEGLARFEREARTAAALNHPNVATIYDVGAETPPNGPQIRFIIQEYLEGQTLRELLKRGRLPVEKALSLVIEIAQGLAAINGAGIVHRDLKPGNIFITRSGQLKILDFGLAKLTQPAESGAAGGNPTITFTVSGSGSGSITGTPGYMAPEQFENPDVDQRADIFAFGTMLYEMVSGRHPFEGKTIHSTIHRIMTEPAPSLEKMTGHLPLRLRWIIEKCLQKNPAARYQHSSDLLVDLRAAAESPLESKTTGTAAIGKTIAWKWLALIAAVVFVSGIALTWLAKSGRDKTQSLPSITFDFPYKGQIRPWDGPAISPDGTMVVYRDSGSLWVRDLRSLTPRKLEGTGGAGQPFWSPHSDSIAYFTQSQLYKISKNGGSITALCRLPQELWGGGYWTAKGTILFGQGPGGIYEVDEQGGVPKQVAKLKRGESWLYWPSLLPASDKLMYVVLKQDNSSEIVVQSAGNPIRILSRAEFITWATYSPTGHILYQLGTSTQRGNASYSIWAAPFNKDKLSVTGDPFEVVSDGLAPTVSAGGTLVYRVRREKEDRLAWVDRQGRVTGFIGQSQAVIRDPSISPDGRRVAAEGADPNSGFDIWIHESRGTKERISSDFADRRHPVWSPKGDQIAFDSGGSVYVHQMDQGSEPKKVLSLQAVEEIFLNWGQGGQTLLYDFLSPNHGNRNIWYSHLPGAKDQTALVQTLTDATLPQISPDGHYVLYQSNESGGYLPDIFAVTFPDGKRKTKISIEGGTHPRWSPRGNEIFYVDPENSLVSLSVTPDLKLGQPRRLFTSEEAHSDLSLDTLSYVYDVGPKADSFVVVQMPTGGRIAVVENWIEDARAAK